MCHKTSKNATSSLPELRSMIVLGNIYLFKVNNRNSVKSLNMSEVNTKDTKTKSDAIVVKFVHISHLSQIIYR